MKNGVSIYVDMNLFENIMDTEYIRKLIIGHFLGNLSDTEKKELFQWLQVDKKNQQLFSEMSDWWAISHVPYFSSRVELGFQKHFGELMAKEAGVSSKRIFFIRPWLQIVATVMIMLAIGGLSYYAGVLTDEQDSEIIRFQTSVPLGSRSKVTLADGSVVWLNAGSSLSYNKDFSEKSRDVYLTGEAYFEVTPDSLKPFIVNSDNLSVKVLGTTFDVRAYQDEELVNVVLRTGKVDVALNNEPDTKIIRLQPNEKLSYNKIDNELKKTTVNADDVCDWVNGKMKFTKIPFGILARDFERKYNIKIVIESNSLQEEAFTGSFTSEHTIYDILNEIDVEKQYRWEQTGNMFVIRDK